MHMKGPQHSHNAYYLLGILTGACGMFALKSYFKGVVPWICAAVAIVLIAKVHHELDD